MGGGGGIVRMEGNCGGKLRGWCGVGGGGGEGGGGGYKHTNDGIFNPGNFSSLTNTESSLSNIYFLLK